MEAKYIVFPTPHEAKLEAQQMPDRPGPDEVLLRTRASAISPGTEMIIYTGRHSSIGDPNATWPRFPFRPGYSQVAEVVSVGGNVTGVAAGERVFNRLSHASAAIVDPRVTPLLSVPSSVSDREASFAALVAIALNGVRLAKIELGEIVVVAGLGLIGQYAAQLALVAGAGAVIGVDLLAQRRDLAQEAGRVHVVDPAQGTLRETVLALTGNKGADVVIDATGSPKAIPGLLRLPRTMGRYVILGSPHGRVEMEFYNEVHVQSLTIIGAHEMSAGVLEGPNHRWTNQDNLVLALQLMAQKRIHVDKLITDVISPAEGPGIYARLATPGAGSLGVVFDWTGAPRG